jgi:hypothetical protein
LIVVVGSRHRVDEVAMGARLFASGEQDCEKRPSQGKSHGSSLRGSIESAFV